MKKLMTTDDVAEIPGAPRQRVQIMCREGQIGHIKIPGGQGHLFTEEYVEECLRAHEEKPY